MALKSASNSVLSFVQDAKKKGATVSAKKLDGNFAAVTLLESKTDDYKVEYTPSGIYLTELKGLPEGASARQFSVCDNGSPRTYWMLTWDTEPEL